MPSFLYLCTTVVSSDSEEINSAFSYSHLFLVELKKNKKLNVDGVTYIIPICFIVGNAAFDIDVNKSGLEINKYLAHIKKFLK